MYFIAPKRLKNPVLLLGSLVFYAWGEPKYVFLMGSSVLLGYVFGRLIEKYRKKRAGRFFCIVSVLFSLSFLLYFKYADFFLENFNAVTGLSVPLLYIVLPIGISFYTFQLISYTVDVYRGERAQTNIISLAVYIAMFPQLVAGPIVRYSYIAGQIETREHSWDRAAEGICRFVIGMAKKILLANQLGELCSAFRASGEKSVLFYWLYAVAFMLHIYFDFSGYSDMAIGLGRILGFRFQENFNYPYISASITEFWRRWHISLSTWFKEYLYIPLGGNRKGRARTYVNKLFVFFCTGLWHGADWTFVIWGLYHGLFLLLEGILPVKRLPRALGHVYTMLVVCAGFVIFRADTLSQGAALIGKMFTGLPAGRDTMGFALQQINPLLVLVLVICLFASCPLKSLRSRLPGRWEKILARVGNPSAYVCSIALLVLCMLSLSGGTYNPFIYFRF